MAEIRIHGVNDVGIREGCRWVELYGIFPAADNSLRRYIALAWANNAWLNTHIDYESYGQINVAIPLVATGATCTFCVRFGDTGPVSNTYGPIIAREATIEIRGLNDRGRNATNNWDIELYGQFAANTLSANITCDNAEVPSTITYRSAGQHNITFPLPATGACCTFQLSDPTGHQITPRVSKVLGRGALQISSAIGAYFWGGMVPMEPSKHDALIEGLSCMAEAGFRTARIRITPELLRPEMNVYNFDLNLWRTELTPGSSFLGAAARSSYYQRAFNVVGVQTFVLTAYDAASMGMDGTKDNYYQPAWLANAANAAAVRNEYFDLTLALCETQHGTGKRFIIANWETDNHVYVDGVFGYVSKVKAGLTPTPSSPSPTERIQGFLRWFQLRKEGINQGNTEARARGWTGVRVDDAIELASFLLLQGIGSPSALFDIIPIVKPAVASYSSWETSGAGRWDEDLHALQRLLAPNTELILGEFGYQDMAEKSAALWRFIEAVKAAKRAHIPAIIVWAAFTGTNLADGLLDFDGNERVVLKQLRHVDALAIPDMSGAIAIVGIRDRGDSRKEGKRYFELYGRFPGSVDETYDVKMAYFDDSRGSPKTLNGNVTFRNQVQINIWIDMEQWEQWYVFSVTRRLDNVTSNEYGPLLVKPKDPIP